MWTGQWSIVSPPGRFCRRALERRLHRFVTVRLAWENICLRRSRLLLYTAIFTWSSWFSHKVNSDASTYFVANTTSSFRLPRFNFLGNQDTEEAAENINNQIRKDVNSKMTKDVVLKCIWPDLRTVTTDLKYFCLKASWRLGNVALKCRPGPGQSQTLGGLLSLRTVKSCQLVWIVSWSLLSSHFSTDNVFNEDPSASRMHVAQADRKAPSEEQ